MPKMALIRGNYLGKKLMFLAPVFGCFPIVALQKKIPLDKIPEMLIRQSEIQLRMVFQMAKQWLNKIWCFRLILASCFIWLTHMNALRNSLLCA